MKKNILFVLTMLLTSFSSINAQNEELPKIPGDKTALLIIDVQEFYFPGGQVPLNNPEKTSLEIKKVLNAFRNKSMEVIHIRHNASKNANIHNNVSPTEGEKVITKNEANSFNGTDLHSYLQDRGISHLVITGMQTHMCVEATTRAAYDKGYKCLVPEETSTTRDLKYKEHIIKAEDVHYSTLSTLNYGYATVLELETLLNAL